MAVEEAGDLSGGEGVVEDVFADEQIGRVEEEGEGQGEGLHLEEGLAETASL